MNYEIVGLLILLVAVLIATLVNLYEKVERLERRLERVDGGERADDEPIPAWRRMR